MKGVGNIFVLMATLASVACSSSRLEPEQPQLGIYVSIAGLSEVKSDIGETVPVEDRETLIKNLDIWVFLSDDFDSTRPSGYCLGFLTPSQNNDPLTGFENRYYMTIPADIAQAHPNVDLYVIANTAGGSINGVTGGLNANTTRATLDSYLMSGTYYGLKGDGSINNTVVPNDGMPFTAVGKNLQMKGSFPVMNLEKVTLKRLVSKVRFVTSQLADAAGPVMDFTIDEIALDGNQISSYEYVFNDSANSYKIRKTGDDASDYVSGEVQFTPPSYADIAQNAAPQEYAYQSGMSGQEYETLVFNGIKSGVLTDIGKCYLRESDKALSGRIKYTITGQAQKTATFQMADGDVFARNTSWIVYIYFLEDEMFFSVNWTPWVYGNEFNLTD